MLHNLAMPQPRKRLVSLTDTPYYHCVSRCVRRAFLCGVDPVSGFDFSHRRGWIVERLKELASVFAIDLCAYAVMSTHYHVVIRVDRERALAWSDEDVAERWLKLFHGQPLVQRLMAGERLSEAECQAAAVWIETWRRRLYDLSWFMRCLNETIARMANAEDHCNGRFWEGLFRSQALLDERAVLACMAYVDLNPIRAAMADTPEASDFTSIQERIQHPDAIELAPFRDHTSDARAIPCRMIDYLQLVDWAGRAIDPRKRGNIPPDTPPILHRLGLDAYQLLRYMAGKPKHMATALGSVSRLRSFAQSMGRQFIMGISLGRRLCPE
jgi:putative transposase